MEKLAKIVAVIGVILMVLGMIANALTGNDDYGLFGVLSAYVGIIIGSTIKCAAY